MSARSAKCINNIIRHASTKPSTNNEILPFIYNRNPRNLEKLRIDRKPSGFPLDKKFLEFWHKLELTEHKYYVVAKLVHNTKKVAVTASTNEWYISNQLYSLKDKMAYITLGKIFAERCQETGIYSFACDISRTIDGELTKAQLFLQILEEECLTLNEMPQFDIHDVWIKKREKKPWTVLES